MACAELVAPDFIRFLFSTKPKFDCYFKVGNPDQGEPVTIGAVKLMLMAHSETFRLQLEDSDLKETGDVIPVEDIHPDTFKGMLKYTYGYDTTSDMCFDEADDLLYVSEKYGMKTFKDKLAIRLMELLNEDNICSLLNNKACYKHLELDAAITNILRHETDQVLANPEFLSIDAIAFLKILEQGALAVTEIQLWRAALEWAKHRAADSEDGKLVREQMSSLTQHVRVLTLDAEEACEFMSSGVLTMDEVTTVCLYRAKKEVTEDLKHFSNKTEKREILSSNKLKVQEIYKQSSDLSSADYSCTILTKEHDVELLPLLCKSKPRWDFTSPVHWTYEIKCVITFTKVMNQYVTGSSSANEPPIILTLKENVKPGEDLEIPLTFGGKNIVLKSDNKYTVTIRITGNHYRYYSTDRGQFQNDHFMLNVTGTSSNYKTYYYFPSQCLKYKVKPTTLTVNNLPA